MRISSRLRRRMSRVFRGTICALVLLGQCVVSLGNSSVAPIRNESERSAHCQNRPCCCASAHESARPCHCFSESDELRSISDRPPPLTVKPTKMTPACCVKHSQKTIGKPSPKTQLAKTSSHGVHWPHGLLPQRCHGNEPLGLLANESVVVEHVRDSFAPFPTQSELIVIASHLKSSKAFAPPTPPPRHI